MSRQQPTIAVHELVGALLRGAARETPSWRQALARLDGKTARIVVNGDSTIDIAFHAGEVAVSNMEAQDSPEMVIEIGQQTLNSVVAGHLTPVEAVFSGALVASGQADDLIMLYNAYLETAALAEPGTEPRGQAALPRHG